MVFDFCIKSSSLAFHLALTVPVGNHLDLELLPCLLEPSYLPVKEKTYLSFLSKETSLFLKQLTEESKVKSAKEFYKN